MSEITSEQWNWIKTGIIFGLLVGAGLGYVYGSWTTADKLINIVETSNKRQMPFAIGEDTYMVEKVNFSSYRVNLSTLNLSEQDIVNLTEWSK